jgi:hypothetical protein
MKNHSQAVQPVIKYCDSPLGGEQLLELILVLSYRTEVNRKHFSCTEVCTTYHDLVSNDQGRRAKKFSILAETCILNLGKAFIPQLNSYLKHPYITNFLAVLLSHPKSHHKQGLR